MKKTFKEIETVLESIKEQANISIKAKLEIINNDFLSLHTVGEMLYRNFYRIKMCDEILERMTLDKDETGIANWIYYEEQTFFGYCELMSETSNPLANLESVWRNREILQMIKRLKSLIG